MYRSMVKFMNRVLTRVDLCSSDMCQVGVCLPTTPFYSVSELQRQRAEKQGAPKVWYRSAVGKEAELLIMSRGSDRD